jgi:hypothetical protein
VKNAMQKRVDILEKMLLPEDLVTLRASVDAVGRTVLLGLRVLLNWHVPSAKLLVWCSLL